MQQAGEGTHLARGTGSGVDERATFLGRWIEPAALVIEKLGIVGH